MDMDLSISGRHWRTEEPGTLQSMESQRVGHDSVTDNNKAVNRGSQHKRGSKHSMFCEGGQGCLVVSRFSAYADR